MSAPRQKGFYRVRTPEGWEIAEWTGVCWLFAGDDEAYDDRTLAAAGHEIGERVEMPDERPN